jgi:hypothetical protein
MSFFIIIVLVISLSFFLQEIQKAYECTQLFAGILHVYDIFMLS